MPLKIAFALLALSLSFISSSARADDCSDALVAESCACRSGAVKSAGKHGKRADKATSPNTNQAKVRVAKIAPARATVAK